MEKVSTFAKVVAIRLASRQQQEAGPVRAAFESETTKLGF